jgi:hypothetical protein
VALSDTNKENFYNAGFGFTFLFANSSKSFADNKRHERWPHTTHGLFCATVNRTLRVLSLHSSVLQAGLLLPAVLHT